MDKNILFQSIFNSYVSAYPTKTKQQCQQEVVQKWNKIKNEEDLPVKVEKLLKELSGIKMMQSGTLKQFWAKQTVGVEVQAVPANSSVASSSTNINHTIPVIVATGGSNIIPKRNPIVQLQLQNEIDIINADLVGLFERRKRGVLLTEVEEKELRAKTSEKTKLELKLKRKKYDQQRSQKCREEKKIKLNRLLEQQPEFRSALNIRKNPGRPRIEEDQPLLLKTIIDIAMHGSAAHEKRQSDVYRSIKTLDDLTNQLNKDGYDISRSAVYLRLLPKRSTTLEGKRHVSTVPVKLLKAQNDFHAKHIDTQFCTATLRHLEELSSLLGPSEVCFLSQDDKSRVPIGITAANKQSPLLMHVEYRVSLPDHDWVIAARHKLIPSVYAGIQIKPNGLGTREAVGYTGPTYIAIRSGKHSSSTAYSHAFDFERLLQLSEFDSITRSGIDRLIKPVVVVTVDGGPDENPRYQKVIKVAISHFCKYDLDAILIATNAPGRSAFNRVERRMAPLSKELSGVILPHDRFGSHLNEKYETINNDLEKQNFGFAGKSLAEIWSQVTVDGFPTIAEYINPEESEVSENELQLRDEEWFSIHVRTSQYFTQVVKCSDNNCCSSPRSSYFNVIKDRFIPPPVPIDNTIEGLKSPERTTKKDYDNYPSLFVLQNLKLQDILPQSAKMFKSIPYDLYCPSVQSFLHDRICKICHLYFASLVMLRNHILQHKKAKPDVIKRIRPMRVAAIRQREMMAIIANEENGEHVDWYNEEELDLTGITMPTESEHLIFSLPIISLRDYLTSPWEEDKQ